MAERKDFLTAPEVMQRLRLGRTTVYREARRYLTSGGTEGLPCLRYGRSLRFPAAPYEAMAGAAFTGEAAGDLGEPAGAGRPVAATPATSTRDPGRRDAGTSARTAASSISTNGQASAPHACTTGTARRADQSALPFTD